MKSGERQFPGNNCWATSNINEAYSSAWIRRARCNLSIRIKGRTCEVVVERRASSFGPSFHRVFPSRIRSEMAENTAESNSNFVQQEAAKMEVLCEPR